MLTVIVLVCSLIATPDRRDCMVDNSVRHELVGQADNVMGCQMAGMIALAQRPVRAGEYSKVLCARPDLQPGRQRG